MSVSNGDWFSSNHLFLDGPATVLSQWTGERYKYLALFISIFVAEFCIVQVVVSGMRVSKVKQALLASCTVSTTHGLIATIVATTLLLRKWPVDFCGANVPDTSFLLQWSTAYMTVDIVMFLLPYTPSDLLLIVHHIITSAYMLNCLASGRAAMGPVLWLCLGEVTGPFLNLWTAAKDLRKDYPEAMAIYKAISPSYTAVYLLVRSVISPAAYVYWVYCLATACATVPWSLRGAWIGLVSLGLFGSQLWSWKLLRGFLRSRQPQQAHDKDE